VARSSHPVKELEAVLKAAEAKNWRITRRPRGYWKMYCPCKDLHIKTVKHSPSNPHYHTELIKELKRKTCWEEPP